MIGPREARHARKIRAAVKTARNIAIIGVLALGVAFLPAGATTAQVALTALTMGFLAAIGFFGYRLYKENQLTLSVLTDRQRWLFYGAFGLIALMIAGYDQLVGGGGVGVIVWIGLVVLAVLVIVRVWQDANRYG